MPYFEKSFLNRTIIGSLSEKGMTMPVCNTRFAIAYMINDARIGFDTGWMYIFYSILYGLAYLMREKSALICINKPPRAEIVPRAMKADSGLDTFKNRIGSKRRIALVTSNKLSCCKFCGGGDQDCR